MANPKFVIMGRGKSFWLIHRNGTERRASDAEVSLWKQLQRAKDKLRAIKGKLDRALADADALDAAKGEEPRTIDLVFNSEPSAESQFIEVESPPGASFKLGRWLKHDGYWILRFRAIVLPDTEQGEQ